MATVGKLAFSRKLMSDLNKLVTQEACLNLVQNKHIQRQWGHKSISINSKFQINHTNKLILKFMHF